jgi:uncharacterized protein YbbC (DUF1343 family)
VNKKKQKVIPGAEVFLKQYLDQVAGAKVGLITNQAGVDRQGDFLVDVFASHPRIDLKALFSPEHGIRGGAQAGEYVSFEVDPGTGLPVHSLYGQHLAERVAQESALDEAMRTFDIREEGKVPESGMLEGLDVVVLDLQDVGTRVYTYASTMAYCMRACAVKGIRFIVLDRPNPINGLTMEGPVLDYPEFSSFVGLYPVPLRHGMTMGELARLFNARFLDREADLTVIPMKGWERAEWYDQTGLPWVAPSPNLPTLDAVTVYPGQVFWEGTGVSEGRGTERPFEQCGAPWIDAPDLAGTLNMLGLPGVVFQGVDFRPDSSKFAGQGCSGVRLGITDRERFRPLTVFLHMAGAVLELYPGSLLFHREYFDRIMGTDTVRKALVDRTPAGEIVRGFEPGLACFADLRRPYLLYA